jgi:uncharacterized repeat protein (TIGR02543 family)
LHVFTSALFALGVCFVSLNAYADCSLTTAESTWTYDSSVGDGAYCRYSTRLINRTCYKSYTCDKDTAKYEDKSSYVTDAGWYWYKDGDDARNGYYSWVKCPGNGCYCVGNSHDYSSYLIGYCVPGATTDNIIRNQYDADNGLAGVYSCPSAYPKSDVGASGSSSCYKVVAAGSYVSNILTGATSDCPGGYYCPGKSSLTQTANNKIYNNGTTGKFACPIGSYGNAGGRTSIDNCYLCSNGYTTTSSALVSSNGQDVCVACPNASAGVSTWTTPERSYTSNVITKKCSIATCKAGYTRTGSDAPLASSSYTCTANTYTVTLNKNASDATAGTTSVTATYGSAMPTITVPSRTGYTFNGYYDTSATSGGKQYYTSNGASANTWDKTSTTILYARWLCSGNNLTTSDGCIKDKFQVTTMPNTSEISFSFYAAGTYYVDCDINNPEDAVQKIEINDLEMNTGKVAVCNYSQSGEYTIGFGGEATNYKAGSLVQNPNWSTAGANNCVPWSVFKIGQSSDSWASRNKVSAVSGRIGEIFSTLYGKPQPTFLSTFTGVNNLTSVPADLFKGVYGEPGICMFSGTFSYSGITNIPLGLFSDINGTSEGLFSNTFVGSQLTSIDPGVFRTIKGPARAGMFDATFAYLTSLYYLPEDLFGGLTKDSNISTNGLFRDTFRQSSSGGIRKLPNRMFGDYVGIPDTASFKNVFANNSNLSGYIPYSFIENFDNTNYSAVGETSPFDSIWSGTSLATSCPANMYQYITGFEDDFDFKVVCAPCPDGGTSPAGSVGVESCTSASVVCGVNQYLQSNGTTCTSCPTQYPNSKRGSRSITDCYAVVTYIFNNGDDNLTESFSYTSQTASGYYATLPEPAWIEDVFDGWYRNNTFTGGAVTKQTLLSSGNQTLYAKWLTACPAGQYKNNGSCASCPTGYTSTGTGTSQASCYKTLSYIDSMDNSSYEYNPGMCTIGETFVMPNVPEKTGYKFTGWTLLE